jgi:hypothetical protein
MHLVFFGKSGVTARIPTKRVVERLHQKTTLEEEMGTSRTAMLKL